MSGGRQARSRTVTPRLPEGCPLSAAAIVSTLLALMPAATGDAPVVSSLQVLPGGAAAGALTASRAAPAAVPAPLRGLRAFSCSHTPARLRCSAAGVLRGHRVRVDYVAFAREGLTRAHVGAARAGRAT